MSPAKRAALLPFALALLLAGLVASPAAGSTPAADSAISSSAKGGSPRGSSTVARIMIPTRVRHRPGFDRRSRGVLQTQSRWSKGPQHLLVLKRARIDGTLWLKLRLPTRPNNSDGWIPASRTRMMKNPWLVRVSVAKRRVEVFKRGRRALAFRAVVGTASTPTPRGLFAIYEKVRQPDPSGFLGPFALHLTSHSNVLDNYGGGPGRVAIHGRGAASLGDPLGSARSHGCIRVGNGRIKALARMLPLGTPVRVR